jgi:hypothetical protein
MADAPIRRPLWDDRPVPGPDNRRRATVTQPCRRCNKPVTATPSKLRPFCSWQCSAAWADLDSRFRRKVGPPVVHVPDLGPCTDWTGKLDDGGYGKIRHNDKFRLAHRVSYELAHGEVPDDLMICHKCNRRTCVNPDHIYAGTAADNMRDLAVANRGASAKTTWDQRFELARRVDAGESPEALALEYGINEASVRRWAQRIREGDIPDEVRRDR